ncbi:hypothetical protein V1264_005408 [Littorina saxatilis]|uniref:Uncharacterized protein n=2 Tax=Littorina saxatilis TaxID=31220 RepID=A0AAN9G5V7_9CAEN
MEGVTRDPLLYSLPVGPRCMPQQPSQEPTVKTELKIEIDIAEEPPLAPHTTLRHPNGSTSGTQQHAGHASVHTGTQCNLVLVSKIQTMKKGRVKATQTLKTDKMKATQTTLDETRGRKRKAEDDDGTGSVCPELPNKIAKTVTTAAATQTDNHDLRGTALEKAVYLLKSVEELSNLSYKIYRDKEDTLKMLITKPALLGSGSYRGDPVFLCLDERGILYHNVLLCPEKRVDVNDEYGTVDVAKLVNHLQSFFSNDNVLCEGFFAVDGPLPKTVVHHAVPKAHCRSSYCTVWFSRKGGQPHLFCSKEGQPRCLPCKKAASYMNTVLRRRQKQTQQQSSESETESETQGTIDQLDLELD